MITGPSGTGKGTLIEHMLKIFPNTRVSVSATTRAPRPGEENGHDYWFVSQEEFEDWIRQGKLLEHERYADHQYGTPRSEIENHLDEGTSVIVEVEVKGARHIKEMLPEAIMLFIAPPVPEIEILRARLKGRGTESDERIEKRLAIAAKELEQRDFFDHIVVNGDLEKAKRDIADYLSPKLR